MSITPWATGTTPARLGRVIDAKAPPSIIAGPPTPIDAFLVAMMTSQQPEHRGIARKAIAGHDADEPVPTRKALRTAQGRPSRPVRPAGPVRRTAAATFGIEHQRHLPLLGEAQHAVDLLVVHVTLGAGQHSMS